MVSINRSRPWVRRRATDLCHHMPQHEQVMLLTSRHVDVQSAR